MNKRERKWLKRQMEKEWGNLLSCMTPTVLEHLANGTPVLLIPSDAPCTGSPRLSIEPQYRGETIVE